MKGFIRHVFPLDGFGRQVINEYSTADGIAWQQTRGATLQQQPTGTLTLLTDPVIAQPVALVS